MFDLKAATDAFLPLHYHATNINSVGAEEHREAAIAACLTHPYRSLAVLLSSYRKLIPCHKFDLNPSASPVGANSFAKAVCQAKMLFSSAFFANEFAPTESPTHSRASLAPTGSKHA